MDKRGTRWWFVLPCVLFVILQIQSASAAVLVDWKITFPRLRDVQQCTPTQVREFSISQPGVVRTKIWLTPYVGEIPALGGRIVIPTMTQEWTGNGWSGWGGQSRYCCAPVTSADRERYGSPSADKWIQNGVAVGNAQPGVPLYTESLNRQDRPLRMQLGVVPRCTEGCYGCSKNQDPGEVRVLIEFFPDSAGGRTTTGTGSTPRTDPGVVGDTPPGWTPPVVRPPRPTGSDVGRDYTSSPVQPVTPPASACTQETVIYTNNNPAGVQNRPTQETRFQLAQPTRVTSIMTYHWNNGRGQPPGTIGLLAPDGRMYSGQATGASGQGGVPNAYWNIRTNLLVQPGFVTITDSDPNTWAQNAQSGGQGIVEVRGCASMAQAPHTGSTVQTPERERPRTQGISPAYDISGIWRSADPGTAQDFQSGIEVRYIYINRGFSHYFEGRYTAPTVINGIQHRINRSNGCLTRMDVTMNVLSQDRLSGEWVAKDSHCDLREGQRGTFSSQRDRRLENEAWY